MYMCVFCLCAQFMCSGIAVLGVLVTYVFIPRYSAASLEEESSYIALEHSCLQPSLADLEVLCPYNALL